MAELDFSQLEKMLHIQLILSRAESLHSYRWKTNPELVIQYSSNYISTNNTFRMAALNIIWNLHKRELNRKIVKTGFVYSGIILTN